MRDLAAQDSGCHAVAMGNEKKRCPCGRTLLIGDNPECQTQVVTIYYCVHGDTAGKPASRVSQAWCCLHEDNEELSAAQLCMVLLAGG